METATEADLAPDGIHLSAAGYKRLANAWKATLDTTAPTPPKADATGSAGGGSGLTALLGVGVALGAVLWLVRARNRG